METPARKRNVVNPRINWRKNETDKFLRTVLKIKDKFEKPTAQVFYRQLAAKEPALSSFSWKAMRDKMKNLKNKYKSAIAWRNNTGAGLDTEDKERTIRENILKLCPQFDVLEELFDERPSPTGAHPLFSVESDETVSLGAELWIDTEVVPSEGEYDCIGSGDLSPASTLPPSPAPTASQPLQNQHPTPDRPISPPDSFCAFKRQMTEKPSSKQITKPTSSLAHLDRLRGEMAESSMTGNQETGEWPEYVVVKVETEQHDSLEEEPIGEVTSATVSSLTVTSSSKVMEKERRNLTRRYNWTKEDTDVLLHHVLNLKTQFEKPTAQIFYKRIQKKERALRFCQWKAMRDKMRNLKLKYKAAIAWRDNPGASLDEDDTEHTIRENVLKLCPQFDVLDEVFRERASLQSLNILDLDDMGSSVAEVVFESDDTDAVQEEETGGHIGKVSDVAISSTHSLPLPPIHAPSMPAGFKQHSARNSIGREPREPALSITYPEQVKQERLEYFKEKVGKQVDEQKISLEREKFQWQQKQEEKRLELEERKMVGELRLKEEEMKNNFKLEKFRIEQEMELKKFELQLLRQQNKCEFPPSTVGS